MSAKPVATFIAVVLLALVALTVPSRAQDDPRGAAQACQALIPSGVQRFVGCWANQMMSPPQQQVVACYARSGTIAEFAVCALGVPLSQGQAKAVGCASQSGGDGIAFAECLGQDLFSFDEQKAFDCYQQSDDVFGFGACVAGGRFLTPEQQVVATCALQTGGEPISLTTCVGGQLAMNELSKCLSIGIGGRGCFGDGNTATALVSNAWRGLAYGLGASNTGAAAMRGKEPDGSPQSFWSWLQSLALEDDP